MRGLENAAPLLDLLGQGLLRPLDFGDVARGLGSADDFAGGRADRRDTQQNLDVAASLVRSRGFEMFDPLTLTDTLEDVVDLGAPVRRNDDVDPLADRFRRLETEQAFGGAIPCGNRAVERLGDDGVVG